TNTNGGSGRRRSCPRANTSSPASSPMPRTSSSTLSSWPIASSASRSWSDPTTSWPRPTAAWADASTRRSRSRSCSRPPKALTSPRSASDLTHRPVPSARPWCRTEGTVVSVLPIARVDGTHALLRLRPTRCGPISRSAAQLLVEAFGERGVGELVSGLLQLLRHHLLIGQSQLLRPVPAEHELSDESGRRDPRGPAQVGGERLGEFRLSHELGGNGVDRYAHIVVEDGMNIGTCDIGEREPRQGLPAAA